MGILIGMDEAGYGPNLGPLVVAGTVWHTPFAPSATTNAPPTDLYELLRDTVTRTPANGRVAIADSKRLYQPGKGLMGLERGVHPACFTVSNERFHPARMAGLCGWGRLVEFLRADPTNLRAALPWHDGFDCRLPVDASADEITELGQRFRAGCRSSGVQLAAIRARLVFPAEFNELVDHFGTKGAALSHVTLSLLRELMDEVRPAAVVHCVLDKHGGRNHYQALVQHHFPEHWIEPLVESRAESRYRWREPEGRGEKSEGGRAKGEGSRRVEICFRTNGEAFLPAALASMTAKYLRELAMRALNDFWCCRVPDLRPTAGYPVDARRYKTEIAAKQRRLDIADHILWRNR